MFADVTSRPKLSPTKREFYSGEEISCKGESGSDNGYYIINVFHRNTNIPLISKQLSRTNLFAVYVTDVTITCTSQNSYLNYNFEERNVSFSSLIKRESACHLNCPSTTCSKLPLGYTKSTSFLFMHNELVQLGHGILCAASAASISANRVEECACKA